jgi:hypothetical protein
MSRSVWKFEVPVDDQWHEISMPLPARVLHVDCQGGFGTVQVWAEVTPDGDDTDTRKMRAFGTGFEIPNGASHVGTGLAGPFVWHVYAEATK